MLRGSQTLKIISLNASAPAIRHLCAAVRRLITLSPSRPSCWLLLTPVPRVGSAAAGRNAAGTGPGAARGPRSEWRESESELVSQVYTRLPVARCPQREPVRTRKLLFVWILSENWRSKTRNESCVSSSTVTRLTFNYAAVSAPDRGQLRELRLRQETGTGRR